MKTLHFDCFAGISGDMCLGALVDLGVDREALTAELRKLGLEGWKLSFENDQRNGITGLHAVVDIEGSADHIACDDEHEHHHEHGHKHEHEHHHGHEHHHEHSHEHEHEHEHHHGHEHHHEHAHNTWKEIRGIIERSGVGEGAKKRAIAIFTAIAEAEAKVHGSTVDEVAFHEVGALDSIIDIVGTAIALDMLKPDRISCGPVELGGGTVKCAHGELPVPAPATLILVEGMPVKTGGFNREMTTPTGAGILAASVDEFTSGADGVFKILKTGYGTGTRRMEKPNLLRISLRETEKSSDSAAGLWDTEILTLMEANIDDMNAEEFGFLMERLFESGALDVTFSPCTMKKSRPGTLVSVLAPPAKLEELRLCFFRHSRSIGFRETELRRLCLKRDMETLSGSFGEAKRKTAYLEGKALRSKIEYEDRARIAREKGISLAEAEALIRGMP